jgi:hypothetical protein
MLVSAMTELVGREVRAGRLASLGALEDDLLNQIERALTS